MKNTIHTLQISIVVFIFSLSVLALVSNNTVHASDTGSTVLLDPDKQTSSTTSISNVNGQSESVTVEAVSDQEAEQAWKNDPEYDGSSVANASSLLRSTWQISSNAGNKNYKIHWGYGIHYAQYYITVRNKKITNAYGLSYAILLDSVDGHQLTHTNNRAHLVFDFSVGIGKIQTLYSWSGILDGYIKNGKIYGYCN